METVNTYPASRFKHLLAGLAFFALTMAGASYASAAAPIPAISITGGTVRDHTVGLSLGYEFTLTQDVGVTALGVYDPGNNGLITDHAVAIYRTSDEGVEMTTTVLTTDTTSVGDPTDGYFVYHDLGAEIPLSAGTYRIATYYAASSPDLFIGGFFATPYVANSPVTGVFGYYSEYVGSLAYPLIFAYPNSGEQGYPWTGPNFLFVVPEPASLGLLALGGLLLARPRRRA
jgi:hypothetical protein